MTPCESAGFHPGFDSQLSSNCGYTHSFVLQCPSHQRKAGVLLPRQMVFDPLLRITYNQICAADLADFELPLDRLDDSAARWIVPQFLALSSNHFGLTQ